MPGMQTEACRAFLWPQVANDSIEYIINTSVAGETTTNWRQISRGWARDPTYRSDILLFLVRGSLAACAGLLHAVGWVFPGQWFFVWVGQAAFILLSIASRPKSAFLWGLFGGTLGIATSFHWGIEALKLTIDAPAPLAWSIFGVLVTFEGLCLGAFCGLLSYLYRIFPTALWIAPFLWTALEHWYPRLFPWQVAYSQLEVAPLIQIVGLVGPTGIGFIVTAVASIPAIAALSRVAPPRQLEHRLVVFYSAAAIILLCASLGYGFASIRVWNADCDKRPKLAVGCVQVDPAFAGSEKKLRSLTGPIREKVDLICWPESAIGIYSERLTHFRDPELTQRLSRDSLLSLQPNEGYNGHLLAGGKTYREGVSEVGPYSMTAFLVGLNQEILGRYRKRTLLAFGEYVPGESYFPKVREWCTLHDVMEAGNDPAPLVMEDGAKLGVLICYEDTLPRSARETVAAGGQALFSLIQGTAFENPLTLRQHLRLAAMRAVENRRYFVRCSSTGVTCIIDPTGRIVSRLPVQTEGTLVGEIALIDSLSLYTRIGDLFPWCCTAVVFAALWVGRRRKVAAE